MMLIEFGLGDADGFFEVIVQLPNDGRSGKSHHSTGHSGDAWLRCGFLTLA